jgi:predicted nucleic acid binding AN1-type Zn finger protein
VLEQAPVERIIQFFGLALSVLGWMQVVLQTKEMITKQAGKIAKRADEHEAFITKVTYSMGVASFGTFCFWLGSSKSIAGSCSMSSAYICSDSRLPKICFCNLFVHLSSPPMICGSL